MISFLRYVLMAIWSILCISSSMIVLLFTFNRAIPVKMARILWAPGALKLAGVKNITITGAENIDTSKTYVVIANHQSYLDIPLLFKTIPINLYFVAKKQLKSVPFLGWYMMATGMIFVDRKNRDKAVASLNAAGEQIKNGKSILMFPEGTRTKDGSLGGFKSGAFHLAKKANVDILPVKIKGTRGIWSTNSSKLKPGDVSVTILPSTADVSNPKEALNNTHDLILNH